MVRVLPFHHVKTAAKINSTSRVPSSHPNEKKRKTHLISPKQRFPKERIR
jgi:hypothetical protein